VGGVTLGLIEGLRRSVFSRCGVKRIVLRRIRSVFGARDIQIDDDGLLSTANDYCLYRLVFAGVQFLMRNVGRNVDEVSGAGFIDELEIVSPAKAGAAAHDIDDSFELSVMMWAGLGVGMHDHGSCP
jgi:hypothetical protein